MLKLPSFYPRSVKFNLSFFIKFIFNYTPAGRAIRSNNSTYVEESIIFENDRVIYCDRYEDVLLDRIIAIASIKNGYGSGSKNSIKFWCPRLSKGYCDANVKIDIGFTVLFGGWHDNLD